MVVVCINLPVHRTNVQIKYAYDGYLLIGSSLSHTALEEVDNISRWAKSNNLRLNHSKTRVILVSRKGKAGLPSSEATQIEILEGAMVVDKILVLGVIIPSDVRIEEHLCKILSTAYLSICMSTL